jgi:hypothetical protein
MGRLSADVTLDSTSSDSSACAHSFKLACFLGSKPPVGRTHSISLIPWLNSRNIVTCSPRQNIRGLLCEGTNDPARNCPPYIPPVFDSAPLSLPPSPPSLSPSHPPPSHTHTHARAHTHARMHTRTYVHTPPHTHTPFTATYRAMQMHTYPPCRR